MSVWQEWTQHPEKVWMRRCLFHIHLWAGAAVGLYIVLMSITGSMIVFRNELERRASLAPSIEWLVDLHENLHMGTRGLFVNGLGAICLILLCVTGAVIWWPGIGNWRRALNLRWKSLFARFSWDLHSALGFWGFVFILLWGVSGLYFAFPQVLNVPFGLVDPRDKFTDKFLLSLSLAHFGRFGWFAEAVWALLGLIPAVLTITGVFLCCRRMMFKIRPPIPNDRELL